MTSKEKQLDKLVQEIATLGKSQWSNFPAECGHHIIGRVNELWRWRLINIAPLTIEEHTMLHMAVLDPLANWQKEFARNNRNKLLCMYLQRNHITKDDFINERLSYLKQVKSDIETGRKTWNQVIQQEREKYGAY